MKFINCSYDNFLNRLGDRKIVQFGASSVWHYFFSMFPNIGKEVVEKTAFIVDNSAERQGGTFRIGENELPVKAPAAMKDESSFVILIMISIAYHESICKQLLEMNLPEDTEVYSLFLMTSSFSKADNSAVDEYFKGRTEKMIPAKIHSFWFSGEEKPELYQRCVDSWHRFCPDFEIFEWNADNYDLTKNEYMYEAYKNRKWAFASDFARLDILKEHGGIYMDMDVELIASIEPLLYADSFFCRQEDGALELGSGFGVPKGDELIGKLLGAYKGRKLFLHDGTMDMTPQPEILSNLLRQNGFTKNHNSQVIDGRLFLSNDYITCYSGEESIRNARYGIHWHNAGWLPDKDRRLFRESLEVKDKVINEFFTMG